MAIPKTQKEILSGPHEYKNGQYVALEGVEIAAPKSNSQVDILSGPHEYVDGKYVRAEAGKPGYPRWKYNEDGRHQLVASPQQEESMGKGWHNSPRKADLAKEGKAHSQQSQQSAPLPDETPVLPVQQPQQVQKPQQQNNRPQGGHQQGRG